MENIWQFSKVYEKYYNQHKNLVVIIHKLYGIPIHIIYNNNQMKLTYKWLKWKNKRMNNEYAFRYSIGYNHCSQCKFVIVENDDGTLNVKPLNYIESRKEIYLKQYIKLIKKNLNFMI